MAHAGCGHLLHHRLQFGEVSDAVCQRGIAQLAERRIAPFEPDVEPGGEQVILDRAQALRALGVAGAHVVGLAVDVAVERGRHGSVRV